MSPKEPKKDFATTLKKYYWFFFGPCPLSDCASFAHQQLWNPSWQAGFMRGRQPMATAHITNTSWLRDTCLDGSHALTSCLGWDRKLGTLNFSTRSSSTDLRHSAASLAAFATTINHNGKTESTPFSVAKVQTSATSFVFEQLKQAARCESKWIKHTLEIFGVCAYVLAVE